MTGAARLLGYVQADELKVENRELGAALEQKEIQLRHKDQVIQNQAETIQQLLKSPAISEEQKAKATPPPDKPQRPPSLRISKAAA